MALSPEARPETQTHILQAARRRYARFGPRKTTMGEVAREAGCSRATLYTHFPSKEALYAGLLENETCEFLAELEIAAESSHDPRGKLAQVLEATLRIYASNPVLRGALTGDEEMALERIAGPAIAKHEKHVVVLLGQILEEGMAAGELRDLDSEAVAYLMVQLGRVLVMQQVSGRGDYPLRRIMPVMDDLIGRGIRAAPAKARKRRGA